jgi:hypothetical protein
MLKRQSKKTVIVSKSIKSNIKEVARNACHRLQCKLQHDVPRIHNASVLPNFLSGVLNSQTEKRGNLQDAEYLFVAGSQFREEFLLLQLKCDLLVDSQDRAYSFRNARNCEDAAQRLQRFVHWEVFFEETFRRASFECPRASPFVI